MKIQKFNKINEQADPKKYWIFVVPSEIIDNDYEMEESYIFDNDEDAFNFLANRIYEKTNNFDTIIESDKDITWLYEQYKDDMNDENGLDNLLCNHISITQNIKLDSELEFKINKKKFNV